MQIDKRKIKSSLLKKGFVQQQGDHEYFYHEVNGKRTGPYTYLSHGSKPKTYGDTLLKRMKLQLRLDSMQQVKDLLECPMSVEDYKSILKTKNIY